METRPLGPFDVSVVGVGCNNFGRRIDREATRAVVDAALDAGLNLFDTADVYGDGASETYLGEALGGRRDEVVIATKFGMKMEGDPPGEGADPSWIRTAVDASLRRLGVDHIDLYQMHQPDESVPIDETLGALDDLVRAGKVRAIGCSNMDADQIDAAAETAETSGTASFVSVQNRYSVLHREPEETGVRDACERHGLAMLPYFPLESGLLTGKYASGIDGVDGRLAKMPEERRRRFADDAKLDATRRLTELAGSRGRTILELAFSWLAAQPTVASVIAGATTPDQVHANAEAAGWAMDDEALAEIDAIVARAGVRGPR